MQSNEKVSKSEEKKIFQEGAIACRWEEKGLIDNPYKNKELKEIWFYGYFGWFSDLDGEEKEWLDELKKLDYKKEK